MHSPKTQSQRTLASDFPIAGQFCGARHPHRVTTLQLHAIPASFGYCSSASLFYAGFHEFVGPTLDSMLNDHTDGIVAKSICASRNQTQFNWALLTFDAQRNALCGVCFWPFLLNAILSNRISVCLHTFECVLCCYSNEAAQVAQYFVRIFSQPQHTILYILLVSKSNVYFYFITSAKTKNIIKRSIRVSV